MQAARETGSLVLPSMPGRGEIQAPTQREEGEEGEEGRRGGGEEGRRSLHVLCKDCAAVLKAALTQDPGTAQGLVPVHKLTASAESFAL